MWLGEFVSGENRWISSEIKGRGSVRGGKEGGARWISEGREGGGASIPTVISSNI